ncbi:hypothetical protein ABPG75_006088 [Micractinium tetrahymenae]
MAADLLSVDSAAWGSRDLAEALAERPAPGEGPAAPQSSSAPRASAPAAAAGATVVVAGAGPAGLLAAAFLAGRHGATVHVLDMRPHPGPIPMPPGAEDDNDRAFALAMNSRGTAAVEAAGLDVPALLATPGADLAVVRDQLLGRGDVLPQADGKNARALLTVPAERSRVVGSRQAFIRGLLHLIEQQQRQRQQAGQPGSVRFTFGAAFEGADLAAHTATFRSENGVCSTVSYDLLVAADGCWSRVRRSAAAQAPELGVATTPANRQYKVIRGLPPLPHLSLLPAPGARPGSSEASGRLLMVTEAPAALVAAGGGAPGTLFFSQPTPGAVTAVLTWPHKRWAAAGITVERMAVQLAVRPLHETGAQVHLSQLHAPGVVFLGDAAHAVSPATSNGMNSALEDALVLSQALEACGGDLAALPAAYTAARLEDARALLWLDGALSAVAGRAAVPAGLGAGPPPSPRANKLAVVARVLLSKLTRGWVRPHALILLKDGSLPYAEARCRVERDAALAGAASSLGALAVAGAALAALLAVGMRTLRA